MVIFISVVQLLIINGIIIKALQKQATKLNTSLKKYTNGTCIYVIELNQIKYTHES